LKRGARPDGPVEALDARDALELPPEENASLCSGCTRCCETVSIEVDAPRAAWEYDQWVWVLHHRGLEMYVEKPERWLLHIETRCDMLDAGGRCSIHGRHPVLCREYDPRFCERRLPLGGIVAWFHDAAGLEAWLQRHRPTHWRRLEAWRAQKAGHAPATNGAAAIASALLQITEPGRGANGAHGSHEPAVRRGPRRTTRRRSP